MFGHLIPCGGGDPIPLRQAMIVIGRSNDCDVVLRFSTISSRHCQLEWQEGCSCWLVRDLASRNGTRVDGLPCEAKLLPPGSVLAIASQRYRVVYGSPKTEAAERAKGPIFAQSLLEAAGLVHWQPEERGTKEEGRKEIAN
jgi:pSer/pThr/pTyr-binding forkhead associated (FHA) protein